DDHGAWRHGVLDLVRRSGFIPSFQFLPIWRDKSQNGADIHSPDVDSLKPLACGLNGEGVRIVIVPPGGKFVGRRMTLSMLVAAAYDLPFHPHRLSGGPDWVNSTRFDIDAAAEEDAVPPGAPPKVRDDQIRAMLRTLVADRFKVTFSRSTKVLPL